MYFLVKIHFIGLFDLKIFCKKVKQIQKFIIAQKNILNSLIYHYICYTGLNLYAILYYKKILILENNYCYKNFQTVLKNNLKPKRENNSI